MKPKAITLALAAFLTLGSGAYALANNNVPDINPVSTPAAVNNVQAVNASTVTEFQPIGTVTDEEDGNKVDVYLYTGVVDQIRDKDVVMKGDDGKLYSIQLHQAKDTKVFNALNLKVGDKISVKSCKAVMPEEAKDSMFGISLKNSDKTIQYPGVEGDVSGMQVIITPNQITANNNTIDIGAAFRELLNK